MERASVGGWEACSWECGWEWSCEWVPDGSWKGLLLATSLVNGLDSGMLG